MLDHTRFPKAVQSTTYEDDLPTQDIQTVPTNIINTHDASRNFRKSIGVVGMLIANGYLDLNMTETDWHDTFKCLVLDVACTLNNLM